MRDLPKAFVKVKIIYYKHFQTIMTFTNEYVIILLS